MSYAGGAALTPSNTAGFGVGAVTKGDTDGSSYPNGGLRDTHTAGGYLALDTSSPIFLLNGVTHIPSAFVSYHGKAHDEKTPLRHANDAMSEHGCRLLDQLGYDAAACTAPILCVTRTADLLLSHAVGAALTPSNIT